jgi:hypothetical protein
MPFPFMGIATSLGMELAAPVFKKAIGGITSLGRSSSAEFTGSEGRALAMKMGLIPGAGNTQSLHNQQQEIAMRTHMAAVEAEQRSSQTLYMILGLGGLLFFIFILYMIMRGGRNNRYHRRRRGGMDGTPNTHLI